MADPLHPLDLTDYEADTVDGSNPALGATTDAANTTGTTGSISGKLRGIVTILANVWDSVNTAFKATLVTRIAGEDITNDVMKTEERSTYALVTASVQIKGQSGRLKGIFVNAASSTPTIKVWDSLTGANAVLLDTFTPVAGTMYRFPNPEFATGCYITITGTVSATVFWK